MPRRARALHLCTIGYEGLAPDELVAALQAAEVTRVLDIRKLPLSRRRGFSKTPLAAILAEAGIEYVHVREAGNPYRELRDDLEKCLRLYRGYLERTPAALAAVLDAAEGSRAALLCVEREAAGCHRSVLVDVLGEQRPVRVQHL